MTLSKQLILSVMTIFIIVFISSLWINVNNTRAYINSQLSSHAQDTATSLGLSIAPHLGDKLDLSTIDTMMNAIFDRGYYHSIELVDANQKMLLRKSNPETLEQVPTWFMELFPLLPPSSSSSINSGWAIVAELHVTSHPGVGYTQLWQNTKQSFWMILVLFVVATLLVFLLLRVITQPIQAVVEQAKEIGQGHFVKIDELPKTAELKVFVKAMNAMSSVLSKMFAELSQQAERYRQFAYMDSLTNLSNRRAFELNINGLLSDKEKLAEGYLFVIRLSSLSHINQSEGADDGSQYIVDVSKSINGWLSDKTVNHRLYRISGADLALVVESVHSDAALEICKELSALFVRLTKPYYTQGTAHLGACHFEAGEQFKTIIEKADSALAVAGSIPSRWQIADRITLSQSNTQWRQQLDIILSSNQVSFVKQPVKSITGKILYSECYARFYTQDGQQPIPMTQLIPASERLNYVQAIDKMVVTNVLARLKKAKQKVAVNLSSASIADDQFCAWLITQLQNHPQLCHELTIELSEFSMSLKSANLKALSQTLKSLNVMLTIEHFGASMESFSYLTQIKPDFIKLDSRFIRNIAEHQDNQFFIQSLVNIAHGLNIKVIAEMVETATEANVLQDLHVDFLQGYFVANPTGW